MLTNEHVLDETEGLLTQHRGALHAVSSRYVCMLVICTIITNVYV